MSTKRCGAPTDTGPCCRLEGHISPTHWGRLATEDELRSDRGCASCGVLEVEPGDHAVGCPEVAAALRPELVYYVEPVERTSGSSGAFIRALRREGPFGSNKVAAERCARKLTKRTGKPHEVVAMPAEPLEPLYRAPGTYTVSRSGDGSVALLSEGRTVLRLTKAQYDALVVAEDAEGRREALDALIDEAIRRHKRATTTVPSGKVVLFALAAAGAVPDR